MIPTPTTMAGGRPRFPPGFHPAMPIPARRVVPATGPTDITLSNATVAEPGTAFVTVGALAAMGGTPPVSFLVAHQEPDTDSGPQFLAVDLSGWKLRCRDGDGTDYRGPALLTIRATDSLGATFDKDFTITIT